MDNLSQFKKQTVQKLDRRTTHQRPTNARQRASFLYTHVESTKLLVPLGLRRGGWCGRTGLYLRSAKRGNHRFPLEKRPRLGHNSEINSPNHECV